MAAPAGLSSGSAPEPGAEPAADPEVTVPQPAQPVLEAAAEPVLEPAEPAEPGGKRRAARLLVVAFVIGIIALAGAVAAVLAVVTHGFRPKTVVTYRPAAVFSLRAGECINSSPNGLSVTVRSCATPHDAEVFATFRLAGSSWPAARASGKRRATAA